MGMSRRISGGAIPHSLTTGRGDLDSHPTAAITGLDAEITAIQGQFAAVVGNIIIDGSDFTDATVGSSYDAGTF